MNGRERTAAGSMETLYRVLDCESIRSSPFPKWRAGSGSCEKGECSGLINIRWVLLLLAVVILQTQ